MDARPRLHVTQRAILTEDDNGVWTGRYGGEKWSVTADSEEHALQRLREKLESLLDDDERTARLRRWAISTDDHQIVFADDDALAAFGPNPLDPACRKPAAQAGRAQGRREAPRIAEFLSAV